MLLLQAALVCLVSSGHEGVKPMTTREKEVVDGELMISAQQPRGRALRHTSS